MARLNDRQKKEIGARIKAFSFSGFKTKLTSDICHYVGSLAGRDFKMVAQVAPFILAPYMDGNEKDVWMSLSKVGFSKVNILSLSLRLLTVIPTSPVENQSTPRYATHLLSLS